MNFLLLYPLSFLISYSYLIFWVSYSPVDDGQYVRTSEDYSPRRSDSLLLLIPASWPRVSEVNPYFDNLFGFAQYSLCNLLLLPLWHICCPNYLGHKDQLSSFFTQFIIDSPITSSIIGRVPFVFEINLTLYSTNWQRPCSTCSWGNVFLQTKYSKLGKIPRGLSH